MSDNLDSLALLLATSMTDEDGICEASKLNYYGKTHLDHFRSGVASNRGRRSGLEGGDSMIDDTVKVIGISQQIQIVEPFHLSNGDACALVHGQALECGIGPGERSGTLNHITYLTAKDVLRWRKLSEWLKKSDRKYPAKEGTRFRSGDESIYNLLGTSGEKSPDVVVPHDTLMNHVSDFPGNSYIGSYSYLRLCASSLAAPIIYGGIHLAAWDYPFASKTEQWLWKIACLATIGTMPIHALIRTIWDHLHIKEERFPEIMWQILWWSLFIARMGFYGLARLYIVVEAFISLRHVPIGAYATIPWVQAIPHV